MRSIVYLACVCVCSSVAYSQVAIVGGVNLSDVRNDNWLQNKKAIAAFHLGFSVRYHPFASLNSVSFTNEILFSRKGYQQHLDEKYEIKFDYIAFPFLINYSPVNDFSLQAGVELGALLFTNVNQGLKTYNTFDLGIVGGFSAFDKRRIGLYSRITYGVIPMLDYFSFDELGNVVADIHDLKNICISIGVRVNVYNKEIRAAD